MRGKFERDVLHLVREVLKGTTERTPLWLMRPGRAECGKHWPLVRAIYQELTGQELREEVIPARERRRVDCVLKVANSPPQIIEVDEKQHFNQYRATTLRRYATEVPLAFDPDTWIEHSQAKKSLEGGGWGKPKPPLFPGDGGRHRQRAFRDALTDILPPDHGFLPTLRIAYFEVEAWLSANDAGERMKELLDRKLHRRA